MKLSQYSRNWVMQTFQTWNIPKDFADPFYNYLVWGFRPGSGFEAILANDFAKAIAHSHPSNTIDFPPCGCYNCMSKVKDHNGLPLTMSTFIVCPECGNKRCPKSTDHNLACTNSNKPGQKGSRYGLTN